MTNKSTDARADVVRVAVDHAVCEASGVCTRLVPEVFELDENDHLHIKHQPDDDELSHRVQMAIHRCPKQALHREQ